MRPDKEQRNRARALRAAMTPAERRLWQALRKKQLGARFRRQAPVGPYIADFLSLDARLIVEVDGGQHGTDAGRQHDARRTAFLEGKGFRVLRFWNNEVTGNLEGVLTRIAEALAEGSEATGALQPSSAPRPTSAPHATSAPLPASPRERGEGRAPKPSPARGGGLGGGAASQGGAASPGSIPPARTLRRAGHWSGAADTVTLAYEARFLRRKRLISDGGMAFLVDLPETVSLNHGDALALTDGRLIEVIAAPEPLYEITGDLPRLAWHVGNRHTPCQIEPHRLLIARDHVLGQMIARLGGRLREVTEPFTPEGGAYGHGRTHGHHHGHHHGHSH